MVMNSEKSNYRVAVVGAGIYGSSIALELAKHGHNVKVYDPLGIMNAASSINQLRIHSGYHYPRSLETIEEILTAKDDFISEYGDSVVKDVESYYAIPKEGSKTNPDNYEEVLDKFGLFHEKVKPSWIDFEYIDCCYSVKEDIYDPNILRNIVAKGFNLNKIEFKKDKFFPEDEDSFDFVIYATYGASGSHSHLFKKVQLQVAEKVKIKLPSEIRKISLVVVDGPFTAFDPYGASSMSQFGSALHTNHWKTFDMDEQIPKRYSELLNLPDFKKVDFTRFSEMVDEACKSVPLCCKAEYMGSRFTLRLVEHNPGKDRRTLQVDGTNGKIFHVFSGKVVSAIKAAKIISENISNA